ncbi:MAG TPA: nuclear transport factor 2 family protein, partial [Anaerolineales bacterium]|nr:nuclear transport factor 2 family protein [Anaerolineales bacterium]
MTQKAIQKVFETYQAAAYAKDVEAFLAIYHQDVHIFDMWEKWSYDGIAAWRGMVTGWFGSLGTELVKIEFNEMQITETKEMAIAHMIVTFRGLSAEGTELRSMQNRMTCVLKNI